MAAEEKVCRYCDVQTLATVEGRLLHALAARAALHSLTPEQGIQKLREALLPPKAKKKEVINLAALHLALDKVEDVKAKGLAFFSSKEQNAKRVSETIVTLDTQKSSDREKLARDLIFAYDLDCTHHCGADIGLGAGAVAAPAPVGEGAGEGESEGKGESTPAAADGDGPSPRSVSAAERHRLCCIFRPLSCKNEHCVAMFSACREAEHDAACEWKILPCPRACGGHFARRAMDVHLDGPCPNKPVDCPFKNVGCDVPCTQGGLEGHLESHTTQHLSLVLGIITNQQQALNTLEANAAAQAAIQAAGGPQAVEVAELRERVVTLEGQCDEMSKQMKASEKELKGALDKDKKEHRDKAAQDHKRAAELAKSHAALEKTAATELQKLRGEHEQLVKTVEAVTQRLGGSPARSF